MLSTPRDSNATGPQDLIEQLLSTIRLRVDHLDQVRVAALLRRVADLIAPTHRLRSCAQCGNRPADARSDAGSEPVVVVPGIAHVLHENRLPTASTEADSIIDELFATQRMPRGDMGAA
jgi:hypothetical protein